MWRKTDKVKVWYEWMVEVFLPYNSNRVKISGSEIHNPGGRSSWIGL